MRTVYFLLIALFTVVSSVFAQTEVSGNQSGVWTTSGSPYMVEGEIFVQNGDTLTIEAGVEIIFTDNFKFTVYGLLNARGTVNDTITFTAENHSAGWGGIGIENSGKISNFNYCKFEYGKTSASDYPDNHGGAVALINSDAHFNHCLFADNDATGDDDGMGGAVYAINSGSTSQTLTRFVNCAFVNNHAYGEGGAIKFSGDMRSLIDSCTFIGNNCLYGGGAIALYSVYKTKIKNTVFANNYTEYASGGAIQVMGSGNILYLTNSTIYGNEARHGDGGAVYLAYAQSEIVNSIVKNNNGMYSNDIFLDFDAYADINYCDLTMPDGATGANNINSDPLFFDSENLNFNLTGHSPCIDAGTNTFVVGSDTLVNINEFYGTAPDMGALEFYPPGGIEDEQIYSFKLGQNYPNPFNPTTTINYVIARSAASLSAFGGKQSNELSVQLTVYDILGRKVATLVNKQQTPGNYSVQFDASKLGSGVYFYTLRAGEFTATKKMILMR